MSNNSSAPSAPPFHGYVDTTLHALRLIHAARRGVIPRITRRLNDGERRAMIRSGAVFVFGVEESGIKRWTDGLLWSPSRIVGNFLVYREITERASSRGGQRRAYAPDDQTGLLGQAGYKGSLPHLNGEQGQFKTNGLLKKTITVTIDGADLHLISYYTQDDLRANRLMRPTSRPDIMSLPMPPHIFRLTNFRVPPKVEVGPDGKPRLVAEPEDLAALDCKLEDSSYSPTHSVSSVDSLSPVDNTYPGSSLYPISNYAHASSPVSCNYAARSSTNDRWPNAARIASPSRLSTSPTGPSSSTYASPGRRDVEVWSSLTSGPGARWNDAFDTENGLFVDRQRHRGGNPYPSPHGSPRESDSSIARHVGGARHRDTAPRGLPWVLNPDIDNKDHVGSLSRASFTTHPSATPPFVNTNYTYGSGATWSDSSAHHHDLDVSPHSPLPPFSPSNIHSYEHFSGDGRIVQSGSGYHSSAYHA